VLGLGSILLRTFRAFESANVHLLHDLEHKTQALHEGIRRNAEHAVRGGAVLYPQDGFICLVVLSWARGGRIRPVEGEGAADERGEFFVDSDGVEGY